MDIKVGKRYYFKPNNYSDKYWMNGVIYQIKDDYVLIQTHNNIWKIYKDDLKIKEYKNRK